MDLADLNAHPAPRACLGPPDARFRGRRHLAAVPSGAEIPSHEAPFLSHAEPSASYSHAL
eukprot:8116627-Pyramimonas_sp.AAC.2